MVGIRVLDRFFKVVDIFLKAPNVKVFGGTRHPGSRGVLAQEIFKIEHSETPFSASVSQERLEFTQILRNDESNIFISWQISI